MSRLLVLLLRKAEIPNPEISSAMGISQGRLSQILNPRKYAGRRTKVGRRR